ncbi:hypothetical protein RclHR1_04010010 [Rhizophagus clarus]|uniref:Ricin B lectin domain-containing protein n=1 Tax=Rhizophagus clarus TaxID=94130 RepID=A0A2Z6RIK8_9GLOM|nr:hypothetical protein RclHR1_04010010 [Rhizophagus clarus]GES95506.1 hypothetical protein RCL_jg9791.t1 [Rhizophagus clarus]
MKFNLLLLILTTLTTVTLSQLPDGIYIIQSAKNEEFWTAKYPNIILGQSPGLGWKLNKLPDGNYLIFDRISNLAVQFNGPYRPLILAPKDENNVTQKWKIKSVGERTFICSEAFIPTMCATTPLSGEEVIASIEMIGSPLQEWRFLTLDP